jgi:outer membrane protein TolC
MKKVFTLIGMLVAINSASAQVLDLDACVCRALERNESILRDITETELGSLIGWDPERELRVSGELLKLEWKLDEAIRMALENRVDLKDLRGQIERQKRIVREARLRRLPEIAVSFKYYNAEFDLSRSKLTWEAKLGLKGRVKRWGGEESGERWRVSLGLNLPNLRLQKELK